MATTLPTTIDQVLVQLNAILDDAVRNGARIGYFAALYERVTSNVRRALIAGNVFDDNGRIHLTPYVTKVVNGQIQKTADAG